MRVLAVINVDNCMDCPNHTYRGPLLESHICSVQQRAIAHEDSPYSVRKLRTEVHESCPFHEINELEGKISLLVR